jgi:hypothetical protein
MGRSAHCQFQRQWRLIPAARPFGDMSTLPPEFDCDEPPEGCYSQTEHYWTIRPRSEYTHDAQRGWLCIGGPGVDGIEFGLLRDQRGVFAYYPITGEYVRKADSVAQLMSGWLSGDITV